MALDTCTPCECPSAYINGQTSFRSAILRVLCDISAAETADGMNIQGFLLCDDIAPFNVTPFFRFIVIYPDLTDIVIDLALDGTTPYVPAGTVTQCNPDFGYTTQVLCDVNAGVATEFIRYFLVIQDDFFTIDTELDGTTTYVPTGTVGLCALQTAPSSVGPFSGQNTVAVAGTQEALGASQIIQKGVEVRALPTNTNYLYVGDLNVSSATGLILRAGEAVFISTTDLSNVYIDVAVSGEGASYIAS